jgi:hypothetical protein
MELNTVNSENSTSWEKVKKYYTAQAKETYNKLRRTK